MEVRARQKRIDEDEFLKMREKALSLWPTGKEVDLEEAIAYQKAQPDNKSFMKVTQRLKEEGKSVIFPRAGTPILEQEIALCRALTEAGIPFIPVTTDSYTRNLQFKKVQDALEEGTRTGKPMLNGFPIINHGVKNTRKVVESCPGAFNPRISMSAQGLGGEIAFASGMTAFSAEPFFYFGSYEKNATIEEAIKATQYTYRLIGHYAERGPIITSDLHGWLPNGVFPMSINIATIVIDALIAAEQGVKSIIPLVSYEGHMAQDLAWSRVEPKLLREYLDRFGYTDVVIPGLFVSQLPLYPAPQGLGEAFAYINYSAMVAALAKAECVSLRTVDEAAGIATTEAHTLTYRSGNWILEIMRSQKVDVDVKEVETEQKLTEMEVRALVDKVIELGEGDVVVGAIKAVDAGIIDSPFCSNKNARDQVLGVKDCKGACRYLEFGNLPLPREVKDFHREKVTERERAEKRKMGYRASIEDFWAFSKSKMLGSPSAGPAVASSGAAAGTGRKPTVVTGTVGMDAHVIGTKVLSRELRDAGFNVVELGCLTQTKDFIQAAIETNADALLMSSLYGMAELDLRGFKKECIESGLENVLLYVGGVLSIGRHDFEEDEAKFKGMGFDRVYPPETELSTAIDDLWKDLKKRGRV